MTWMKAGEFTCENGCKAVVLGRVPAPNDVSPYNWHGYVVMIRGATIHRKMSWTDEGTPNVVGFDPGLGIKQPTDTLFMGVTISGNCSKWMLSFRDAVEWTKDVQVVIAAEFLCSRMKNVSKILVFLPDGPNAWRKMQLDATECTHILTPNVTSSCKSKNPLSEQF